MSNKPISCLKAGIATLIAAALVAAMLMSPLNRRQRLLRHFPASAEEDMAMARADRESPATSGRVVFDMTYSGTGVTKCYDALPSLDDMLRGSLATGFINVTYRVCCGNASATCRTSSRPLEISTAGIQALRACAAHTVDAEAIDLASDLVMVTGSSSNHFEESLVMLHSFQLYYPQTRMLYWDLGLTPTQAKTLRSVCGISYRYFNFTRYPPHFANLQTYAFKAAILVESLIEHSVIWWVDASIRFTSSDTGAIYNSVVARHGLALFKDYRHTVYAATYPQMYEYIATDAEQLKGTRTAMGGSFILVNTEKIFSTLFAWFFMCSFDRRCIAPVSWPEPCDFRVPGGFAHCHRFDQSLVSILASNIWGFSSDRYLMNQTNFIVSGTTNGNREVALCSDIH